MLYLLLSSAVDGDVVPFSVIVLVVADGICSVMSWSVEVDGFLEEV